MLRGKCTYTTLLHYILHYELNILFPFVVWSPPPPAASPPPPPTAYSPSSTSYLTRSNQLFWQSSVWTSRGNASIVLWTEALSVRADLIGHIKRSKWKKFTL